jgi:hypothetical protein
MRPQAKRAVEILLWMSEHMDKLDPVLELDEKIWYRKRHEMEHLAIACGIHSEFQTVGDYIHQDDIIAIKEFLGVTDDCMFQLFEESDLPGAKAYEGGCIFD